MMHPQKIKVFLQLIAVAHIAGGLLLPLLVNTVLFASYNSSLYETLGFEATRQGSEINFLLGLFGPTIASWGILFFYVVTTAFRQPDKHGWWAIFLCCLVWAPYDSVLSIQKGVYINALINLGSSLAILIPLFMARKHFVEAHSP